MVRKIIPGLLLIPVLLIGCSQSSQETEHEHGPEPVVHTVYSEKTELFVEYKPLVVGSPTAFATHLTVLGETFQPLKKGEVTVSLIVDNKGVRQSTQEPSSPGIYRLQLTPVKEGKGKLIFEIKTPDFSDRIEIEGVTVYSDEDLVPEVQGNGESVNEITYLKEEAWKVEFANVPVVKEDFSEVIRTSGRILPAPGDEVILTSKTPGIVFYSDNGVVPGTEVSAGTRLFTVTGSGLTEGNIDADFMVAKRNYEKAKADYERAKLLVDDQIISQKEFQEIERLYENARVTFNTLAGNYSSGSGGGQSVTSGTKGFIKDVLVSEGQFVAAGTPLAIISQNKRLILQADLSQKHFLKLSSITSANFKMAGMNEVYESENLNGKVIAYGKSISSKSPFIPVTIEIDNIGNLIPGTQVEVFLKTTPVPNSLVIPVSALIEEQGIYSVFVQTGGETFEKRKIQTGASDGTKINVLSGLEEGDRVVSKGAYHIKLTAASGELPAHGHEH